MLNYLPCQNDVSLCNIAYVWKCLRYSNTYNTYYVESISLAFVTRSQWNCHSALLRVRIFSFSFLSFFFFCRPHAALSLRRLLWGNILRTAFRARLWALLNIQHSRWQLYPIQPRQLRNCNHRISRCIFTFDNIACRPAMIFYCRVYTGFIYLYWRTRLETIFHDDKHINNIIVNDGQAHDTTNRNNKNNARTHRRSRLCRWEDKQQKQSSPPGRKINVTDKNGRWMTLSEWWRPWCWPISYSTRVLSLSFTHHILFLMGCWISLYYFIFSSMAWMRLFMTIYIR